MTWEEALDQILCPGAVQPAKEGWTEPDDVGMPRCRVCRKPVLIRDGVTSAHGRESHLRPA